MEQLEQLTEKITSGEPSDEVKLLYAPDRNIQQKLSKQDNSSRRFTLHQYKFPQGGKACYLGDMLSVDGDADAAMETIIRIGWNKFSWYQ